MMSRCFIVSFRGWLWFYLFPIHKLYYDVSVFIPVSNVPRTTFSELSNSFTPIKENVYSLTVFSPIFLFPNILFPIRRSESSLTVFSPIFPFPFVFVSICPGESSLTMLSPIFPFPNIIISFIW